MASPPHSQLSVETAQLMSIDLRPAQTACLLTTELLENIIIHLPPTDIITSRLISKAFNEFITTSKAVRQAIVPSPVVIKSKWFEWQYTQKNCDPSLVRYKAGGEVKMAPFWRSSGSASREQNIIILASMDGASRPNKATVSEQISKFEGSQQRFATWPPCCAVRLHEPRIKPRRRC